MATLYCPRCRAAVDSEGPESAPGATCPRCGVIVGHADGDSHGADEESAQRFERKLRRIEEVLAAAEGVIPSAPTSPPAQAPAGGPGQDGGQLRGRILVRRELPPLRQSRLQRLTLLGIVAMVGLGVFAVPFLIWGPPWQVYVLALVLVVPWLIFIGWLLNLVLRGAQPPTPPGAVPSGTASSPVPRHSAGSSPGAIQSPPNTITGM